MCVILILCQSPDNNKEGFIYRQAWERCNRKSGDGINVVPDEQKVQPHMHVVDKYKIMLCLPAKAGSTNMLR